MSLSTFEALFKSLRIHFHKFSLPESKTEILIKNIPLQDFSVSYRCTFKENFFETLSFELENVILFSFRKFLIIEVLARNDYPFKYEAKYNFLFDNTNNLLKSKNQQDIKTDFEFVLSVFLNFLNDLSEAYEDYAKNPGL